MANHSHHHDHDDEDTLGIALGFRIVEEEGGLYLAEAEIAPYIDSPDELGVTIVFHPLDGINPIDLDEETDWPSWPVDIDDDLTRDGDASLEEQFTAIARQLQALETKQLLGYLRQAREEAGE